LKYFRSASFPQRQRPERSERLYLKNKPLGRRAKTPGPDRWFKKKQKERNRIEGAIGHGKEHFGCSRVRYIRYKGEETSEVWVRASLLAMNLKTALKRA